jgi:probable rRNA maturation factor
MSDDGSSGNSGEPPQAVTLAAEVVRHGGAWDDSAVSDATLELAAHAAFTQALPARPTPYEATILLTDDAEMRDLNRTWRGKDEPTNVLSFPAGDTPVEDGALGDVAIAYETAKAEADQAGIPLSDHVSHLVVHGVLHLLGFDHLDDAEADKMEDLEREALASLGIADPYAHGGEAGFAEMTR